MLFVRPGDHKKRRCVHGMCWLYTVRTVVFHHTVMLLALPGGRNNYNTGSRNRDVKPHETIFQSQIFIIISVSSRDISCSSSGSNISNITLPKRAVNVGCDLMDFALATR